MAWGKSEEQRHTRRVAAEWPMQFSLVQASGAAQAPVHTLTTSVSRSGLSFVSPMSMPVKTRLRMSVSVPKSDTDLEAEGVIARINTGLEAGASFEYGVLFDPIPEDAALARFVDAADIVPFLEKMEARQARTLYLTPDKNPLFRTDKGLEPALGEPISAAAVETLVQGMLSSDRRAALRKGRQVTFGFPVPGVGRWRVHVHHQGGALAAAIFRVSESVPGFDELGLPQAARDLILNKGGLVLVCGPVASGKGATLAALVDLLRRERESIIATVESPVEFIHGDGPGLVLQREVGSDVSTVADGLRQGVWQGADVLVAGNLADSEAMDMALDMGASGRRVLAAVAASDPLAALESIPGLFPQRRREHVLHRLASALSGLIGQRSVPSQDGSAAVRVYEVFTVDNEMRKAIRAGRLDELPDRARADNPSTSLEYSLAEAVHRGALDRDTALSAARDTAALENLIV